MKAQWRKGYQSKIPAEIAAEELDRIKEENGGNLTADLVVLKAKSASNPLHKQFEWSNKKAAEEYRKEQARNMLRAIHVVYETAKEPVTARKYEVVTEPAKFEQPERKVYQSMEEILQNPVKRDEVLARAIKDALAYRKKYSQLSELSKVFKAIDDTLMNIDMAVN